MRFQSRPLHQPKIFSYIYKKNIEYVCIKKIRQKPTQKTTFAFSSGSENSDCRKLKGGSLTQFFQKWVFRRVTCQQYVAFFSRTLAFQLRAFSCWLKRKWSIATVLRGVVSWNKFLRVLCKPLQYDCQRLVALLNTVSWQATQQHAKSCSSVTPLNLSCTLKRSKFYVAKQKW